MNKSKSIVSVRYEESKSDEPLLRLTLFSNTMKKFFIFLFTLLILIGSEYYFLTELFAQKRIPVLAVSLLVTIGCLFFLFRYFKRSIFPS